MLSESRSSSSPAHVTRSKGSRQREGQLRRDVVPAASRPLLRSHAGHSAPKMLRLARPVARALGSNSWAARPLRRWCPHSNEPYDLHEREQQSKRRRRRGAVARQAETKPQAQPRAPEPVPASADPAAAAVSGDALAKEHHMVGGGRWQRRRCPRRGACEHGKTLGIVTKCCRPLAAGPSRAARAAASEARAPARPRRTGPMLRAAASARHRFAATTLAALRRAFVIGARCGAWKLGRARGR